MCFVGVVMEGYIVFTFGRRGCFIVMMETKIFGRIDNEGDCKVHPSSHPLLSEDCSG